MTTPPLSTLLFPLLVSTGVCVAVLFFLLRSRWSADLLDMPVRANAMHNAPVPRIGGLGIAVAAGVVALAWRTAPAILLLAAAALAAVSYLDDRRGLPVLPRLLCHLLAAVAAVYLGIDVDGRAGPSLPLALLLIFAVVWMTNIFNFMDGADGMAGGMAAIGFAGYALAAGDPAIAIPAAAVSGAALGFLFFNFPPARIFMGDAGSIPLGFLAAALGLLGSASGQWAWWFPVLVFSPFVVDASSTLLRRIFRRERIWQAHRGHYYQRLILAGWSHRKTALAAYLLMLCAAVSALTAHRLDVGAQGAILAGWVVIYGLLLVFLERRLRPDNKDNTK